MSWSRSCRRSWLAAALLGLSCSVLAAVPSAADPTGSPGPAEAPPGEIVARTEAAAATAAAAAGRSVEVADLTSETTQVSANPDGSFSLREHARPVRVRAGDGWVPVDTTLVRRSDGTVGPVAIPVDLAFSAGGSAPAVRVGRGGRMLDLTWPSALPVPELVGDTAVYADVVPGVDLRLRADVEGYSQVLVVRDRAAAAHPLVRSVRLAMAGSELVLAEDAAGVLTARDGATPVLQAPQPVMWDSAGEDPGDELAAARGVAAKSDTAVAPVGVEVTGSELVLTPDRALLDDPGTVYPVYIDPSFTAGRTAWTSVHKKFPTTSYWNANDVARVGYESDEGNTNRSLFLLNTTPINGKRILRATFRSFETHSWSCSARPVELWLTGPISASTTWNTQPAWLRRISTVSVAKKANPSCPAGGVEMDATSAVVDAARNNWTGITLGLRATSETDSNGWKKFQSNPSIGVDYNTVPGAATAVASDQGVPCVIGGSRPTVGDLTPTLYARFSSGDTGQNVRARFEWFVAGGAKVGESVTLYQASNSQFSATVPAGAFASGQVLSWHVRGEDGIDSGPFSSWCEYALDSTGPTTVPSVTSTDYPENGDYGGGVGYDGSFTFGAGTTTTDVAKFEYAVNAAAPLVVTADGAGTATVTVTPDRSGTNVLRVQAVDAANNRGPAREYQFNVVDGAFPTHRWTLDDGTATVATDTAFADPRPLSLTGGAGWAQGRDGGALSLTGATATAASSAPAVPTDRSFTVAAWVRLTSGTAFAAAVSQDGTGAHGNFALMYSSTANRWTFTTADASQTITRAIAPTAPQLNVWTHLAGVYEEGTKQIHLYVDGVRVASAAYTSTWNATGPFRVGGFRWAGSTQNPWTGAVDDVRVWNRAVYGPDILAVANASALAARWALDEGVGTVAADASGNANTGTLGAGTSWSTRNGASPAVAVNGSPGGITTLRAPIRTDKSFSVTAFARVTDTSTYRTVVDQSGGRVSAFTLSSLPGNGAWAFSIHTADVDNAVPVRATTPTPAVAGTWVHLAGTYDATTRTLRFYVDGLLVDTEVLAAPLWNATGPPRIGLAKHNGLGSAPLLGDVDDVRLFTGVLSSADVQFLSFE